MVFITLSTRILSRLSILFKGIYEITKKINRNTCCLGEKMLSTFSLIRDLIPDPIASQAPNLSALAPFSMQRLAPPSAKL